MHSLRAFLNLIKFEHTVFALPFAYLGMVLAAAPRLPTWHEFLWITVAMAAARTAAMSFNRWADREIDARNPRTAARPIQRGLIGAGTVLLYALLSLAVLLFAAWQLNPLTLMLAPGAVALLAGYAFAKRFTWLAHFILGLTDGLAPMGAWAGVRGSLFTAADWPAWLLGLAVTFWIGGFDLIYACQDTEVDRREGLHSIPARFGNAAALAIARVSHALTLALLAAVGFVMALGLFYWLGLAIVAGLLVYEHSLVRPDDLSKVNVAFFNVNGYISVTLFVATALGLWLR
jgi:4-hydroxybenzoate polyprenyltransferase